jgi:hypothetical protein
VTSGSDIIYDSLHRDRNRFKFDAIYHDRAVNLTVLRMAVTEAWDDFLGMDTGNSWQNLFEHETGEEVDVIVCSSPSADANESLFADAKPEAYEMTHTRTPEQQLSRSIRPAEVFRPFASLGHLESVICQLNRWLRK